MQLSSLTLACELSEKVFEHPPVTVFQWPTWAIRWEESVVKTRLLTSLGGGVFSGRQRGGSQDLSGILPYALQKLLQPVSWGPEAVCMFKLGQNLSLYPSVPSWLEFSAFLICWGFFFPVVGAEVLQISKAGVDSIPLDSEKVWARQLRNLFFLLVASISICQGNKNLRILIIGLPL